jgi:hypothetical protein
MSALDKAVAKSKRADGTDGWDFQCPGIQGSPCGDPAAGVPFRSTGWPTKATATARGAEHFAEHKGEGVTSSLEEFRAKHELGVDDNGHAVSLEDL